MVLESPETSKDRDGSRVKGSQVLRLVRKWMTPEQIHQLESLLIDLVLLFTYTRRYSWNNSEIRLVSRLLGMLWTVSAHSEPVTRQRVDGLYGKWLADSAQWHAQCTDAELLQDLEVALRGWASETPTVKVGASVVSAWLLLRERLGERGPVHPPIPLSLPNAERIVERLQRWDVPDARDRYDIAINNLLRQGDTLTSARELTERVLRFHAQPSEQSNLLELWRQVREALRSPDPCATFPFLTPDTHDEVLAAFLSCFLRQSSMSAARNDPAPIVQEVMDLLPRPYPRLIGQVMLAFRAQATPSTSKPDGVLFTYKVEDGDARVSLARPESRTESRRDEAVDNLRESWALCGEKDVKTYMMYMSGVANHGGIQPLIESWNELRKDEECKAKQLAADPGADTVWPPTNCLNLYLSSLLHLPRLGGRPIALELFETAIKPDSGLQPDMITINTILRHYAGSGDMAAMNQTLATGASLGLKPDIVTYTSLVQGLIRAERQDLAQDVIDSMYASPDTRPNGRMASMLIAHFAKQGTRTGLQTAEKLLTQMVESKDPGVSVVTWTGLIGGYFRGRWEDDAWAALERMHQAGVKLNRVSYNMILKEAGEASHRKRGESQPKRALTGAEAWTVTMMRRMIDQGISPNSDTYTIVLGPLIDDKRWQEAEWVKGEMSRVGFVPEKRALQHQLWRLEKREGEGI